MFFCSFPANYWLGYCVSRNNYYVDGVIMKIKTAVIFLALSVLACGTQLPTAPSQLGSDKTETHDTTLPVKMVISDPTDAVPVYMTTGALNVRAEANADSTIIGTLAPFTEIHIFITYEKTDGCYGGEWYQIFYKPDGGETVKAFVCSLWVVRK